MAGGDADQRTARLLPSDALTQLAGVGPATAAKLAGLGIATLRDLVALFPRRCRPLRDLPVPCESAFGELVRLRGKVHAVRRVWLPAKRSLLTVEFAARDGAIFRVHLHNQPWLAKAYRVGQERQVEGELRVYRNQFVLVQARILPEHAEQAAAVQLRYPTLPGVSLTRLQKWLAAALQQLDWQQFPLPALPTTLAEYDQPVRELFCAMHQPPDEQAHERARLHFALREAVELFREVERARQSRQRKPAQAFPVDAALAARILARLPFALTNDQQHALAQLWRALAGPAALGMLLQGDVGTGKTAVAIAAALAVLARGGQVAFLSPTETLTEQHHRTVSQWLQGSEIDVLLLTASRRDAPSGKRAQLIFGTHALLTAEVALRQLAMVIVDEQHRFGVDQRMALVHKADNPHVLVMTATPIPRTLALTLFGDLDVLQLRERPPGHRAVRAVHVPAAGWGRVLACMARNVARGGRVFVVCPAVGEQGEKGGVVRMQRELAQRFRCGTVHGRQQASARQAVLAAFRAGELDVLIGTTVLEVGVDVPQATLIVVAAAERFGIATLHQLRGRVGRGSRRGLAILCGLRSERVAAVCRTSDGFALAEVDLRLRGSGELLGTAQSGFADLRALDPTADLPLLLQARRAVKAPELEAACKND